MTDKDPKKASSLFKTLGLMLVVLCVCTAIAAVGYFTSPDQAETEADTSPVSTAVRTPPPPLHVPSKTPVPVDEPTDEPVAETMAEPAASTQVSYSLPSFGEITAAFDDKNLVYSEYFDDWRTHAAMDFDGKNASEVFAAADGVLEKIYTDSKHGLTLVLSHADGCKTFYSSLAGTADIKEGDSVTRGDVIGTAGDSCAFEKKQGVHLHFWAEKDGKAVNLF